MQDLESTLHFMFRQEIAIHRSIEDDKITALKDFVNVLAKVGKSYIKKVFSLYILANNMQL